MTHLLPFNNSVSWIHMYVFRFIKGLMLEVQRPHCTIDRSERRYILFLMYQIVGMGSRKIEHITVFFSLKGILYVAHFLTFYDGVYHKTFACFELKRTLNILMDGFLYQYGSFHYLNVTTKRLSLSRCWLKWWTKISRYILFPKKAYVQNWITMRLSATCADFRNK